MRMTGEKNGNSKLKTDEVRKIRNLYSVSTQQELADMFGVCQKTISNIVNNKIWKEV